MTGWCSGRDLLRPDTSLTPPRQGRALHDLRSCGSINGRRVREVLSLPGPPPLPGRRRHRFPRSHGPPERNVTGARLTRRCCPALPSRGRARMRQKPRGIDVGMMAGDDRRRPLDAEGRARNRAAGRRSGAASRCSSAGTEPPRALSQPAAQRAAPAGARPEPAPGPGPWPAEADDACTIAATSGGAHMGLALAQIGPPRRVSLAS